MHAQLKPFTAGTGRVEAYESGWRMTLPEAARAHYSDAQLDDYGHPLPRSFSRRPPLQVVMQARFSSADIVGTAGFGFWNHPFGPGGGRLRLPRALWFFYASPPSNMALAMGVPGFGWKAAAIDATGPSALMLAPAAPLVVVLNRSRWWYDRLWPVVQRGLRITETALPLDLLPDWHVYSIGWENDRAVLSVDQHIVLETARPPRGAMGFVTWIDNQYAVVTPQGQMRFGLLDAPRPQWLEIKKPDGL
jgi:hypothetical protein